MCLREGMSLQRGMNFRSPSVHGIVLMSRRPNAPYEDEMSSDESVLLYEGHDVSRTKEVPDPKSHDQPRRHPNGKPTENGKFADSVDHFKASNYTPATFRVYEKMHSGIWTDRGMYLLKDYDYIQKGIRRVFRFRLEQAEYDSSTPYESAINRHEVGRQIPSSIKQQVYKRDGGRCVKCGATDQLHFDHDFPYSKGGTSVLAENVRILCARHNLAKSAKIE